MHYIERMLNERDVMYNSQKGSLRQEQAAITRNKLLESAHALFAENGYKGTPVRAINRKAGLADGLLYHYFPGGKKEIFKVVVLDAIRQIIGSIYAHFDDYINMPLESMLESIYMDFVTFIDNHDDILRIILRENEVREYVSQEQLEQVFGNRVSQLSELLCRKSESGEVREMDFDAAAMEIYALFTDYIFSRIFHTKDSKIGNPVNRKKLIDYQVHMWKNP